MLVKNKNTESTQDSTIENQNVDQISSRSEVLANNKHRPVIQLFTDTIQNSGAQDKTTKQRKKIVRWTEIEDKALLDGIKKYSKKWKQIADEFLGGKRTGMQCQSRYQQSLNTLINKGTWAEEEDEKLLQGIEKHGLGKWQQIADEFLGGKRTGFQCQQRYQQSLNTLINRGTWAEEEDEKLLQGIEKHGLCKWQQIADEFLGGKRTGIQCQQRYQQSLNTLINKGTWAEEEDEKLLQGIEKHRLGKWQQIADEFLGGKRTGMQCRQRYEESLNTLINKGTWAEEEDEKLLQGIEKHGLGKWKQIADEFLCGKRIGVQCQSRYEQSLNTSIDKGTWAEEEDEKLLQGIEKHGLGKWQQIADEFLGGKRTGMQCKSRYEQSLNTLINKGSWAEEEDEKLLQGIEKHGLGKWQQIADEFLGGKRTGNQCRLRYEQSLNTLINRGTWAEEEDEKLLQGIEKHGLGKWQQIADEFLGGKRTGHQCQQRYEQSLNTLINKGTWAEEEDEKLLQGIEKHGLGKWQQIADEFLGGKRTGNQCRLRYQQSLNTSINKGSWVEEEDEKLLQGIEKHGLGKWQQIADEFLGGKRIGVQCQSRYERSLNTLINKGTWAEEEDEKLLQGIEKYGVGKWQQIADEFLGGKRTRMQCRQRYQESLNTSIN